MAADLSFVRQQYTQGLQNAARAILQLNLVLTDLNNLYAGAGLSGTFTDAELAANVGTKHMLAVDVGTYTANLNTITSALTSGVIQNMAKAVGVPV